MDEFNRGGAALEMACVREPISSGGADIVSNCCCMYAVTVVGCPACTKVADLEANVFDVPRILQRQTRVCVSERPFKNFNIVNAC